MFFFHQTSRRDELGDAIWWVILILQTSHSRRHLLLCKLPCWDAICWFANFSIEMPFAEDDFIILLFEPFPERCHKMKNLGGADLVNSDQSSWGRDPCLLLIKDSWEECDNTIMGRYRYLCWGIYTNFSRFFFWWGEPVDRWMPFARDFQQPCLRWFEPCDIWMSFSM